MDNISLRLMFVALLIGVGKGRLSHNHYERTCPDLLSIIDEVVNDAVRDDRRMGASLLRLHFHDCFVHGCDASVLLDDRGNFIGEKTAAPNNNSLRGFHVIDDIKAEVEWWCPGVVSCADILAVAARDGVVALGGPRWSVPLGRRDSTTASRAAADSELPGPSSSLTDLISVFSNKGLSHRELVALSGAHTIGKARCINFRRRLYNDDNIKDSYAAWLEESCPRTRPNGDNNLSPLDGSPTDFNNDYYKDLRAFTGLLHSDQELFNGGSTDALVRSYSTDTALFFKDFAEAMVKMSSITPLTGTNGQIRRHCRRTN